MGEPTLDPTALYTQSFSPGGHTRLHLLIGNDLAAKTDDNFGLSPLTHQRASRYLENKDQKGAS